MNWVVISDEVSALGWRLAGARVLVADEHTVLQSFAEARRYADLLFVTADLARRVPDAILDSALLEEKPLLAVISALPVGSEPPDLDREVQHALGITV